MDFFSYCCFIALQIYEKFASFLIVSPFSLHCLHTQISFFFFYFCLKYFVQVEEDTLGFISLFILRLLRFFHSFFDICEFSATHLFIYMCVYIFSVHASQCHRLFTPLCDLQMFYHLFSSR